jgi:hypothetical protein
MRRRECYRGVFARENRSFTQSRGGDAWCNTRGSIHGTKRLADFGARASYVGASLAACQGEVRDVGGSFDPGESGPGCGTRGHAGAHDNQSTTTS